MKNTTKNYSGSPASYPYEGQHFQAEGVRFTINNNRKYNSSIESNTLTSSIYLYNSWSTSCHYIFHFNQQYTDYSTDNNDSCNDMTTRNDSTTKCDNAHACGTI